MKRPSARSVRAVSLVVTVLVVVAFLVWFGILAHYRPALSPGEAYGVDVSNHQGAIDWVAVAGDGVQFAYIKATEGRSYVDPFFAANWSGAQNSGVRPGAYHFFSLCSPGVDQADAFLRTAPPQDKALPPALDLEILGGCADRPSAKDVQAQLDAFTQRVEQAWGRPFLIYARDSWTKTYPQPTGADRPQWRTAFFIRPDREWAVWQVHYFTHVDGIEGRVDSDVARLPRLSY